MNKNILSLVLSINKICVISPIVSKNINIFLIYNKNKKNIIQLAYSSNKYDVIKLLLLNDCYLPLPLLEDIFEENATTPHGDHTILEILIKNKKLDIARYNNQIFRLASNCGNVNSVNILLKDNRVNPTEYCNEPIRSAIRNNHCEITQLLLDDNRVHLDDDKCKYAFFHACKRNYITMVNLLLNNPKFNPLSDIKSLVIVMESLDNQMLKILLDDHRIRSNLSIELYNRFTYRINHL